MVMFLRKFKSTTPDVIVLILIIAVIIWIRPFIHPEQLSLSGSELRPMPLFALLLNITGTGSAINALVAFLIVLLTSFLLVNFNTSEFFLNERTFLPALIYVLLSGLFPMQQVLNPALPGALFLILTVRKIMDSYKVQYTAFSFFDAGLLISTGSLFYAGFIWFSLLLIIGLALLRTGNLREIIISLLGLITPWFIISGIYYISGNDPFSVFSDLIYNIYTKKGHTMMPSVETGAVIVTGLLVFISTTDLFSIINTRKIKSRKTFRLLLWAMLIAAVLYIFIPGISLEVFWIGGVPVSYFLTNFFVSSKRKLISEVWFLLLFIVVATVQIVYLIG
jgi:hypothetical protein